MVFFGFLGALLHKIWMIFESITLLRAIFGGEKKEEKKEKEEKEMMEKKEAGAVKIFFTIFLGGNLALLAIEWGLGLADFLGFSLGGLVGLVADIAGAIPWWVPLILGFLGAWLVKRVRSGKNLPTIQIPKLSLRNPGPWLKAVGNRLAFWRPMRRTTLTPNSRRRMRLISLLIAVASLLIGSYFFWGVGQEEVVGFQDEISWEDFTVEDVPDLSSRDYWTFGGTAFGLLISLVLFLMGQMGIGFESTEATTGTTVSKPRFSRADVKNGGA